jgi:hypothetical protein
VRVEQRRDANRSREQGRRNHRGAGALLAELLAEASGDELRGPEAADRYRAPACFEKVVAHLSEDAPPVAAHAAQLAVELAEVLVDHAAPPTTASTAPANRRHSPRRRLSSRRPWVLSS